MKSPTGAKQPRDITAPDFALTPGTSGCGVAGGR
jgi:hypothetical protein